ncbi:MAG: beta-N-acetylhexosaminidase [Candidatus Cloacimonadaceae bacterium]|jgi:hexosaminidase|nr:beta-N-acetylhexosaminidase [Candidatus Cloacimonadota bacterium]MDY0126726.1 beta-N-acetylhexosaminidase [Candidatus Cloacimonadaceae bacterium]MCB5255502.1 beta-N-acetylhexosaminidase [Candidatus Cloacimonadota bacterium]MCK9178063.1 beta-N-acetylhexosaminidase [Candidatus Cloacimonadota bacterium]MCK9242000.1 beta-N-acetylhexosaminidase [Candidatus Cloacimonadota bacterium]
MIPFPRETELSSEQLPLPQSFTLVLPQTFEGLEAVLFRFQDFYEQQKAARPELFTAAPMKLRLLQMPRIAASHKDMHLISIEPPKITLSAKSMDGFRYAFSSLKQLIYLATSSPAGKLNCGRFIDYPSYDYRGLHLDESRHFFGMNTVKSYLDYMADLKLNYLHWHLSDDQGWRLESKRFPLLSEIAAWRKQQDGSRYGGFYTQDEIRELIAYAADLGITIVPEIDLPGHSLALLQAYPALGCEPHKYRSANSWGVFEYILCPGKDATMDFVKELLQEYCELFPGPYFHIGGDEVPKTVWKRCPDCQARMRQLNLQDYEALQGWFTDQLTGYLKEFGKKAIAWDEVLDGAVDKSLIAMLWRGDAIDAAKLAAANGNSYILCPNKICYLDWKPTADEDGAHGVSTVENVYSLSPQRYARPDLCLGLQANLWTEYVYNPQDLYHRLHPRAVALAERAWNPTGDYAGFASRLKALEDYFAALS